MGSSLGLLGHQALRLFVVRQVRVVMQCWRGRMYQYQLNASHVLETAVVSMDCGIPTTCLQYIRGGDIQLSCRKAISLLNLFGPIFLAGDVLG